MITLTELKALLRETGTSNDTYYTMLIPYVIESICQYCKNYFLDENLYIESDVVFSASAKTVVVEDYDDEFAVGDYIRILDSKRNNYHALITNITNSTITLSQCDVKDEESAVTIYRADYPKNLKLSFSNIVKYVAAGDLGIEKKEKIDDYEIEYWGGNLVNGLPEQFLKGLSRYKKFYWDDLNYDF